MNLAAATNNKTLIALAGLQLQLAVLNGESWAIKHVLNPELTITVPTGGSSNLNWDIRIMGEQNATSVREEKQEETFKDAPQKETPQISQESQQTEQN